MNAKVLVFITIILTFILINLGGYVHNTGASLACPDWPLCYGQVMPKMEGGVLIEHSHRMLASLVGFFTILIVFFVRRQNPKHSKLAWTLLALVIFQGILGGLTVIYKLPTMISTAHLGTSMIFFLGLITLFHKLQSKEKKELPSNWSSSLKSLWFIGGVAIYLQMLLGAFMRHLGLGGVCGVGMENSIKCFDTIEFVKAWIPISSEAQIHSLHRFVAFGLFFFFVYLLAKTFRHTSKELKDIRRVAVLAFVVLIVQVKLGILVIASNIEMNLTTAHLGGATFLIALAWKNYLNCKLAGELGNETSYNAFSDILSLTKPKLSGLVIFSAAIGLYLSPNTIPFYKGLIAILSTSMIVAGACVLNCYMEIAEDGLMNRTKERPLPSGRIEPKWARNFGAFLVALSLYLLFVHVNVLTGLLGLVATVFYLFLYTPMKKKSWFAVFVGAIPGAIPPLMGWTSASNSVDPLGLILFAILFVWQLPHFLSISIFYADDYKNASFEVLPNAAGLKSTMNYIVIYTIVLLAVSLLPMGIGFKAGYSQSATVIGLAFLLVSLMGLFKNLEQSRVWAKRYFWGSLIYLPLVLGLIVVYSPKI